MQALINSHSASPQAFAHLSLLIYPECLTMIVSTFTALIRMVWKDTGSLRPFDFVIDSLTGRVISCLLVSSKLAFVTPRDRALHGLKVFRPDNDPLAYLTFDTCTPSGMEMFDRIQDWMKAKESLSEDDYERWKDIYPATLDGSKVKRYKNY